MAFSNKRSEGSRARAQQARASLIAEYNKRTCSTKFIDRRIGETDPAVSKEDRYFERFAQERLKAHASRRGAKKASIFSLQDQEDDDNENELFTLTHRGQSLDQHALHMADDSLSDFDDESDSEQGMLSREQVLESHFGGPAARKKSKREVMDEVIGKSKFFRAERQRVRSDNENLRLALNADFADIQGLLSIDTEHSPGSGGPAEDASSPSFDMLVSSLAREPKKAKAADRLLSSSEIAQQEIQKLERLEAERLARMAAADPGDDPEESSLQGRPDFLPAYSSSSAFARSASELDALGALLAEADQPLPEENEIFTSGDDDDGDDDDEERASGDESDGPLLSEWGSEDGGEEEEAEEERRTEELGPGDMPPPEAVSEIPFLFQLPSSLEDFRRMTAGFSGEQILLCADRIGTLFHRDSQSYMKIPFPLPAGVRSALEHFALVLIEYSLDCISSSADTSAWLAGSLVQRAEELLRGEAGNSAQGSAGVSRFFLGLLQRLRSGPILKRRILLFFLIVERLFSASDRRHAVVSPCVLWLGELLLEAPAGDLAFGLKLAVLAVRFTLVHGRVMPELALFLSNRAAPQMPHSEAAGNVFSVSSRLFFSTEAEDAAEWGPGRLSWLLDQMKSLCAPSCFPHKEPVDRWGLCMVFRELPVVADEPPVLAPLALQDLRPEPPKLLAPLLLKEKPSASYKKLLKGYKRELKATARELRDDARALALHKHQQMLRKRRAAQGLAGKEFRLA